MKIALYSDLHNECGVPWEPPESGQQADVVVLAGDIGRQAQGLEWATRSFPHQPIVYVAGNHEYYGAQLGLLSEFQMPYWQHMDVHFLERHSVELNGVRFLGCTLWSGFNLFSADNVMTCMKYAQRSINDYWMINTPEGKRLEPRDTLRLHKIAVRWLEEALAEPFAGKTVVVTHFAPHRRCVAPEHAGSDVSPSFVTDLSWLMEKYPIALWCYGHTHTNTDFIAENGCRVVSNQLGYPGARTRMQGGTLLDTGFRSELLIEV